MRREPGWHRARRDRLVSMEAQGLILQVRAAERAAIDAALSGSRALAIRALALHPLVPVRGDGDQHPRRLHRTATRAPGGPR